MVRAIVHSGERAAGADRGAGCPNASVAGDGRRHPRLDLRLGARGRDRPRTWARRWNARAARAHPAIVDADRCSSTPTHSRCSSARLRRSVRCSPAARHSSRHTSSSSRVSRECRLPMCLRKPFDVGADLARTLGCVVLLKGVPTVLTAPNGKSIVSAAGTPALATGGSGDVLAGIAGTLLAQMDDALDAGCLRGVGPWARGGGCERGWHSRRHDRRCRRIGVHGSVESIISGATPACSTRAAQSSRGGPTRHSERNAESRSSR